MSGLPAEILAALAEQGIDLGDSDPRKALAALGKALAAARKALPKRPPVRFEERGEGDELETVLRVQRGGKGAPLCVNRHAAVLMVAQLEALIAFSETGEAQPLEDQDPQEEDDDSDD